MKTTLLVVAKNEIEGMKAIMPKVPQDCLEQILLLDGNSNDGTAEYAREQGYDVYVQKEPGLRSGYQEIWPLIKGDWVITFSPDGNALPEDIPVLINKMQEGYDMVIASRYYKDSYSEDDDILTAFGNKLFTGTMNFLYRWNYSDSMTIFRIYRKELFQQLELNKSSTYSIFEKLFFTRIGVEPILSARFAKEKLKFADIPSPEPERIGSNRKLQIFRWGFAYMTQIIFERFTPRRLNNHD